MKEVSREPGGDNHKVFLNDQQVLEVNSPRYNDVSAYAGLRTFKLPAAYKSVTVE